MLLSKGKVFLLRADPASEKSTVQKLQNLSPPHTHTVRMAENKERGRGDKNIPFILFEGISKSILFNSILNAVIYLVFNVKNYLALIRGGGSDKFTASEKLAPPPIF